MEELERHRGPLHDAADDLRNRVLNIREEYFFETYLAEQESRRSQLALLSTAYRFAKYWAIVERLYSSVVILRFQNEEHTRHVAEALRLVGRTMASDEHGPYLMRWREEQRAVAEAMQLDGTNNTMGFDTFVRNYEARFKPWFSSFLDDLAAPEAQYSDRLSELQHSLQKLVGLLQVGRPLSLEQLP